MKKKIVLAFVAVIMLVTAMPLQGFANEMADAVKKLQELNNKQQELKKQIEEIEDSLERLRVLRQTRAEREALIRGQIEVVIEIIKLLDEEIAIKQQELDQAQRDLDYKTGQFLHRMRTIYINSDSSGLSVILGATSFSEFLALGEYLWRVTEYDQRMIEDIKETKNTIIRLKEELEFDLRNAEDQKNFLDELYEEAARLLQETNTAISLADAQKHARQAEYDAIIEEFKKQSAYINSLMNQPSNFDYNGEFWAWPVPGYGHISSHYGWRVLYGAQNFHTGIDIAGSGIHGKNVIASDYGVVQTVVYGSTGYGYYIIVDHGSNYKTLYAHLSAIYVSEGDHVVQGHVIGAVGSTGNSTGPHLHFEIRVPGLGAVDPLTQDVRFRP